MDNRSVLTTSRGYPSEVIGRVDIVKEPSGNEVLGLTYDFTGGTGTKAVYAVFNQGQVLKSGDSYQIILE
ncbi:hypothetical protein B7C51_12495 [Paenibacillus larvae subsp. pulvifaciens]|uniref:Uncharacterized protein n=1 Tax=Paenibacillus larvae subsp. pulvifaciens TaxID=1477 RepID=A0A1V0UT53_9BACL|nr:hypothetical protein [Paenibacillus larvae]ARF68453.1 hypothetical protein B7C51_12495 [Paenibacillus larvae subsp. pulvifaciens]